MLKNVVKLLQYRLCKKPLHIDLKEKEGPIFCCGWNLEVNTLLAQLKQAEIKKRNITVSNIDIVVKELQELYRLIESNMHK